MYCSNCGRELSDSTKFCPYCGTRLAAAPGGPDGPAGPDSTGPSDPGIDNSDPDGTGREPKKRRWLLAAALVVLALVLGLLVGKLAGGVVAETIWSLIYGTGDATTQSEEDATTVYYSSDSDGTVPAVLSSTTIVFYSADGEELEEYDLYLMDGAGALTHCHVDAETGPFTPGGWDIAAGSYRLIVREPETNTVHTLDRIAVVDEDDGDDAEDDAGSTDSDSDAEDDADYIRYDDELNIKPNPDDSDSDDGTGSDSDGSTSAARQAAYALYYERVLELQELYGEAALDSAGEYLSGLAFVGLVDLAGDEDGIEELVLVYNTGSDAYSGWTLEVWRYDADSNDIEPVCEKPFGGTGNADMVITVYDCGETAELEWSYWAWENRIATVTTYVVRLDGDSLEVLEAAYTVDYDADEVTWLVDGTETDQDAYNSFVETMLGTYSRFDSYSVTAGVTASDAEDGTTYDPTDTLSYTQETIGALQLGMMDLTEDELWGTDEDEAASTEAVYEGYAAVLSSYQASCGSVSQEAVYEEYPYLTGLCFAKLIDFDGDGVSELVLAYSTDDVSTENGWTDNYTIEIWGANAANDGAELLFQGSEWAEGNGDITGGVAITTIDGVYYLAQGEHTDNMVLEAYSVVDGKFVKVKSSVEDYDYDTYTATYLVDGTECSSEEFYNAWENYTENLDIYWLMFYDDDYSDATTSLSETLAELGVA